MSEFIDITGNRYNRLIVLERSEKRGEQFVWKCQCDCGKITYVRGSNLKSGAVKSCGCLRHESRNATHKMSKTRIYRIWAGIKTRCCYKSSSLFKDYAPRGITICDEWKNSFEAFRDWAYKNGYDDSLSIERIDNDKGYFPKNCKWIPRNQQSNNRRMNYSFTMNGETKNLSEWCKEFGIPYSLVHNRIWKLGWDFEKAITVPCDINKRNYIGGKKHGRIFK